METKQVFLDREEDDLARAVWEKASCVLSDSHIDPCFKGIYLNAKWSLQQGSLRKGLEMVVPEFIDGIEHIL